MRDCIRLVTGQLRWGASRAFTARAAVLLTMLGGAFASSGCRHSSGTAPQVTRSAGPVGLEFAADRQYLYAVELNSEVEYGAGARLALDLRARLELQRSAATPSAVTLTANLAEVRFPMATPDSETQFGELAAELQRGFELTLEGGKIRELRAVSALSPFASNIARSLAAALELPVPAAPAASSWTAETADAAGSYALEVSRTEKPGQYRKRKLRYSEQPSEPGGRGATLNVNLVPRIVSSAGEVELLLGVLQGSVYEEMLESELGQGAPVRAHNRLKLTLIESRVSQAPLPRATTPLEPAQPRVVKVDRSAMDAAKIAGMSFDQALAKLGQEANEQPARLAQARDSSSGVDDAPSRDQRVQADNRTFSALTAIVRSDRLVIRRALALIRRGAPLAKLVLDALVAADTPESHSAVIALADDRTLPQGLRAAAAHGLARFGTPSAETLDALLRLSHSQEHALTALYGLGTQARHLKEQGQTELAHRAALALIAALENAPSDEARVHALHGVANSGLAECLPAVEPLLAHSSELVRGAAVEALRLMDDARVDTLIATRLSEEKHGFALRSALTAAKARRPSAELDAAVAAIATGSIDNHSRYDAVGVLARWVSEQPNLREVLARVAQSDSVDNIRTAARSAL